MPSGEFHAAHRMGPDNVTLRLTSVRDGGDLQLGADAKLR